MKNFVFKDAEVVKAEINRLLTVHPDIAEDVELFADTLEGQTGLYEILEKALSARQEADMMVSAIKEREAALEARRKRYEEQSAAYKALMLSLMQYASQEKVTLVTATLSITKPRAKVIINDVDELPQGFFKTERVADKTAIKDAISAGVDVPGADIDLGEPSLTIRTK